MDCGYQKFPQDHTPAVSTRGCGWLHYAWWFILSVEADVVAIFWLCVGGILCCPNFMVDQ